MSRKLLSLVFLLSLSALGTAQDVFYIDAINGDDANSGRSLAEAKATIGSVGEFVGPGDQVLVYPGVYRELQSNAQNTIFVARSGSREGGYLRYTGVRDAAGNRPVIESASRSAFGIHDRIYLIIEGFELRPSSDNPKGLSDDDLYARAGINISVGGNVNSHHIILRDLYIHDFGGAGIGASSTDVLWIDANVVEHCAYGANNATSGISLFRMRDFAVGGFTEAGEPAIPAPAADAPAEVGALPAAAFDDYRLLVTGNTSRYNVNLRNNFRQEGNSLSDGQGIILDDFRDVELLGDNSLQTGAGSGPEAFTGRSLVQGNECYGNGAPGINAFLVERVDIFHNTLYDNGQTRKLPQEGFTFNLSGAQIQVGGVQDVNVQDNILVNTNAEFTSTVNLFLNPPETAGVPVAFSHNLHYNTAGSIDLPTAVASPTNVLAAPQFANARPLTPEETELLATAESPYTFGTSASSALREPTATAGFPVQDFALTASSPAVDAGTRSQLWPVQGDAPDIGGIESPFTAGGDEPDPDAEAAIGEVGSSIADENWTTVTLTKTYDDPVVVLGPLSNTGGQPATTRVRNVTANSFEWRVDEWEYLDEGHLDEEVAYVVMEAGFHTLANGAVVKAGKKDVQSDFWIEALGGPITELPVVLPQVVTENEAQAVSVQIRDITLFDFELRLREEEGGGTLDGNRGHGIETVAYLAIEPGTSDAEGTNRFEVAVTGSRDFDTPWQTLDFALDYPDADRLLFAGFQTTNGGDPWSLRYNRNLNTGASSFTADGVQVYGQEETSSDTETGHVDERLGYWVVGTAGLLFPGNQAALRRGASGELAAGPLAGVRVVNPAAYGEIELALPAELADERVVDVEVFSPTGIRVARRLLTDRDRAVIDVGGASEGLYLVHVTTGGYRRTIPVVVTQ